ncbi:MAG TPA: helix-turn-helix domain-containing protein [Candidatus Dormibacteraeota bacterium]|nr:helix-turn-helix domain-containing protein [Candidatus Dormibacteraeota bacterium]
MHGTHLQMVEAVLAGGGLLGLAEVTARLLARPVAVMVPKLGDALAPADALRPRELRDLTRYVRARVGGWDAVAPGMVALERAVMTGTEMIGCVVLLAGGGASPPQAGEMLGLAAVAALTELAIAEAREEAQEAWRSSLIELIRANADVSEDQLLRRAYRLGSDLSGGAVALCGELSVERPRYIVDLIRGHQPRALVEPLGSRIYALLPPPSTARDLERGALEAARAVAGALEPYAIVGFSPYCPTARRLHRAVEEAELVLEVLLQEGAGSEAIDSSTYRLLVRTLAAEPDEVRRFYENTVAPLVRYDDQYHTDLVATLETYLAHNCNMNQTAGAIFAHRHTIAYRPERVRELTGLDPSTSEHRERLGLGLKAYRILAPRLPR